MKYYIIFFILFFSINAYSQDTIPNSQSWKNLYVPKTLLRVGVGYQKSFYTELGFTRRKYVGEDMFILGRAYYGSLEWNPITGRNKENIYGLKFGGELTIQPLLIGIEAKYQTNLTNQDFILTPKIGIGGGSFTGTILSHFYICYGYNISFNNRPFPGIGRHQFSLVLNPVILSRLLNKKRYTKKLYK